MTKEQFASILDQAFVKLADWDEEQRSRILVPAGHPEAAFMDEPWDGEPVAVIYNIGPAKEQG